MKNYAKIAGPLIDLLAKDAIFLWEESPEEGFVELKEQLTTHTPLGISGRRGTIHSGHGRLIRKCRGGPITDAGRPRKTSSLCQHEAK